MKIKTTTFYVCDSCGKEYLTEEDAALCQNARAECENWLEQLKDKVGHVLKFNSHYVLIGKLFNTPANLCRQSFSVDAADSNDRYYYDGWFANKDVEVLTLSEAVAGGWRTFSPQLLKMQHPGFWLQYVEAMRSVPYEVLFDEAVNSINKRSSWGD